MRLHENGTVRLAGIKPEMAVGLMLMQPVFDKYGVEMVITAGTEEYRPDGSLIHMKDSLHPEGYAVDLRSREIVNGIWTKFLSDLRGALGCEFQVIEHDTHLHVEFDPRRF